MAKKEKSYGEILTAGFIKENPVLRLVLGTCPTLAKAIIALGVYFLCLCDIRQVAFAVVDIFSSLNNNRAYIHLYEL